jgi:hypothetical protein
MRPRLSPSLLALALLAACWLFVLAHGRMVVTKTLEGWEDAFPRRWNLILPELEALLAEEWRERGGALAGEPLPSDVHEGLISLQPVRLAVRTDPSGSRGSAGLGLRVDLPLVALEGGDEVITPSARFLDLTLEVRAGRSWFEDSWEVHSEAGGAWLDEEALTLLRPLLRAPGPAR